MRFAIVTTTIHVPHLLKDYAADAKAHGQKDVKFIVAGDRKTPREAETVCIGLAEQYGYPVAYLGIPEQDDYLAKYPELAQHLPWDSVQRRNVGILMAYEEGFDVIVTIDDDNYLYDCDYLRGHDHVGREIEIDVIAAESGWFNVCHFLEAEGGREFFARGYPLSQRELSRATHSVAQGRGKVVVNGGLWLGDPDIDAVTRLAAPVMATGYKRGESFALAKGTWCPFNSQNTALAREAIPAYFLSPHVGRYDDIWASYVVKSVADHMTHLVSFGRPLTRQTRNLHDLWDDLDLERMGMQLTETFCDWLRGVKLNGSTYEDCVGEILDSLESRIDGDAALSGGYRGRLRAFVEGYRIWLAATARCAVA